MGWGVGGGGRVGRPAGLRLWINRNNLFYLTPTSLLDRCRSYYVRGGVRSRGVLGLTHSRSLDSKRDTVFSKSCVA